MVTKAVSLGTSSNPARHKAAGNARLVNCYAELAGREGKTPWPLMASDGLADFATLPDGAGVRAMYVLGPDLYVVAGRLVFQVSQSGAATVIGGIPTDGLVAMAQNSRETGNQIGVASDGFFGIIENGSFEKYQDVALRGPSSIAVLDGYAVTGAAGGYWQNSGQNNMRSWDALEVANAESYPDGIVRTLVHEREALFFGDESLEWWQNSGAADFSFARTATRQIGCASGASVSPVGETVAWIDDENNVRLLNGYGSTIVSTGHVSRDISKVEDKSEIKGFSWTNGDHSFYCIRHSTWCHVYDLYTKKWHERESLNSATWRVADVVRFGNKLIAGDATTGKLYEMSADIYDEAGEELVMSVQPPEVHGYPKRVQINRVFIDVVPGVGALAGDEHDLNPELMLQWSFDGGHNWSHERRLSVGQDGKRLRKVTARRLGVSREDGFTFKISVSANVAKSFTGFAVDAEQWEE